MPTFLKPTAAALNIFTVRLVVIDGPTPIVSIEFGADVLDANGNLLHRIGGDLRPFLGAPAQASFETAALALFAKAKTELLG